MVLGLFWVGLILWRNRRRALPEGVCQSAIRVRKAERRDSGAGISSESYGRVSDEPPSRCALNATVGSEVQNQATIAKGRDYSSPYGLGQGAGV